MALSLEGKVAVVTGSSRGIGKVIALQLGADGARVVVCARTEQSTEENPGSIGETAEAILARGGTAMPVKLDVTSDAEIHAMVGQTLAAFGRIDILVNNAGVLGGGGAFLGGDPAILEHFYRTNVRAPYVLSQVIGEKMAERGGGVIFNISSGLARMPGATTGHSGGQALAGGGHGQMGGGGQGRMGGAGNTVYGLTKAALDRFTAGVAPELREKNIAIISIYPGMTMTERFARMMPGIDASRLERPETTAKAVAFLSRDPMPYTGQVVVAREIVDKNNL